ncbi:ArsR/SmtB family transcription factor [Glycomyces xiaoerkulensis]|uniref:ArsR/SmtB family transcription factor n=1 Tax=Glycomyces xiaoerkulensis TaxID=2038139 RepID=UPI0018E4BA4F|nr:helix-turn-helix domain-containing protein [Glycomyces xiaoerkulensis]
MPDLARVRITDPERMKALAHPARLEVFNFLSRRRLQGFEGATATEIAEAAGMTPSAMSYHLRTLAKTGYLEEAPNRGDARERVWRLKFQSLDIGAEADAPESDKVVSREMAQAFNDQHARSFQRWLEVRDQVEPELRDLSNLSQGQLRLTIEEAEEFRSRLMELNEEFARKSLAHAARSGTEEDGTVILTYLTRIFPHT